MNTTDLPGNRLETFGSNFTRYALVIILLWVGALKFTAYEAKGIEPLVSNSFLFAWAYKLFGLPMLSKLIGVTEIITGLLIAMRRFSPMASVLGGFGAIIMFSLTLTFFSPPPGCGSLVTASLFLRRCRVSLSRRICFSSPSPSG